MIFGKKEQLDVQKNIHTANFYTEQTNRKHVTSKSNSFSKQTNRSCRFCNECHRPHECQKYATITSKLEMAKKKGLCFNCLKKHVEGFSLDANSSRGSCKMCGRKRHTVSHKESTKSLGSQNNSPTKERHVKT